MKEALERQDSAAMFYIAGHPDKARAQFAQNSERFNKEFLIAANNITEPGEAEIVADIKSRYAAYHPRLEDLLNGKFGASTADQTSLYFGELEPSFVALKNRLDDLLHLNQSAMVGSNDRAMAESHSAERSMTALSALALIFAFIFAWRFTKYIVKPISSLTESSRKIAEGDLDQRIDIQSNDEIGRLAEEFNRMTASLRELRQSDYGKLLMERKKSDAVIDSIYEPVIVTDAQGHTLKVNRAAEHLFKSCSNGNGGNTDNSEITLSGFSAGDRIMRSVRDAVALQRPVASEDDAALVPVKIGGTELSYRLRTTPIRDAEGRLLGAVTLLEDITAMREVDRLKTEFVSVASMKLRAPLYSLSMALYALREKYADEMSEDQRELLDDARSDAEHLNELMSDLLELAEIESGSRKLNLELVRPCELVQPAVEQWRYAADFKHIKIVSTVAPDLPRIMVDRGAIKRVFDNLLSNAIRYTSHDGRITISAEEREHRIIFSVKDTGEGIPEEYLPNIFGRFIRVESTSEGGTGLGLALFKRLIEAQDGQVGVESRVGEGTSFTFSLPVNGSAGQP
jgi:NtrC-family two-component system sensor histidine kinase KinB